MCSIEITVSKYLNDFLAISSFLGVLARFDTGLTLSWICNLVSLLIHLLLSVVLMLKHYAEYS
jgi:hypothetical protein